MSALSRASFSWHSWHSWQYVGCNMLDSHHYLICVSKPINKVPNNPWQARFARDVPVSLKMTIFRTMIYLRSMLRHIESLCCSVLNKIETSDPGDRTRIEPTAIKAVVHMRQWDSCLTYAGGIWARVPWVPRQRRDLPLRDSLYLRALRSRSPLPYPL